MRDAATITTSRAEDWDRFVRDGPAGLGVELTMSLMCQRNEGERVEEEGMEEVRERRASIGFITLGGGKFGHALVGCFRVIVRSPRCFTTLPLGWGPCPNQLRQISLASAGPTIMSDWGAFKSSGCVGDQESGPQKLLFVRALYAEHVK